jgi:hypothetical protein
MDVWAQGMISRHFQSASSEKAILGGRQKAAESEAEENMIRYCRSRHSENNPITVEDAIDPANEIGTQINTLWVYRFGKPRFDTLAMQTVNKASKAISNRLRLPYKRYISVRIERGRDQSW